MVNLLTPRRYRIEHRHADEPPVIVAFADTLWRARAAAGAQRERRRLRGEIDGELVVVDQATETDLRRIPIP